jgi:hypothetical protein
MRLAIIGLALALAFPAAAEEIRLGAYRPTTVTCVNPNGTQESCAGGGAGGATAANQTAPQADPGSDATKAVSVQGITGGKAVPVSQSGTWTVQPGNTANTTAWKVDGSAVTQPVSAASLPLPSGAATSALQTTGNTALTTINTTLGSPLPGRRLDREHQLRGDADGTWNVTNVSGP